VPDAGLRAIYTATKAHDLREAVIDTVIQNHPEMMAQTEQVTDVVKQVFTSPIKPEDLQDVIYTAFTFPIEEHVTAISIEQTKALQIKFDSTMARILDDLYKKNACMSDEVLFDKARELTYRKMQRSFGIFADKSGPSTTSSEPKKTISPK